MTAVVWFVVSTNNNLLHVFFFFTFPNDNIVIYTHTVSDVLLWKLKKKCDEKDDEGF